MTVRETWFDALCSQVVESFPSSARPLLKDFDAHLAARGSGAATLGVFVADRHRRAKTSDEITLGLRAFPFFEDVSDEVLYGDLVAPLSTYFRTGRIPFYEWWDAEAGFVSLLVYHLYVRLGSVGVEEVLRDLEAWRVGDADNAQVLLTMASAFADFGAPPSDVAGNDMVTSSLSALVDDPEFHSRWEEVLDMRPAGLRDRPDLVEALQTRILLGELNRAADEAGDSHRTWWTESFAPAVDRSDRDWNLLTPVELHLATALDPDARLLRGCAEVAKTVLEAPLLGPDGLPDQALGRRIIPAWMLEWVWIRGGQLHHASAGIVPHFCFDAETQDVEEAVQSLRDAVRITLDVDDDAVVISLVFETSLAETFSAPFVFRLEHAQALSDLAMLILAGYMRVDVLKLSSPNPRHVVTGHFELTDQFLAEIREPVLREVRRRCNGDALVLKEMVVGEMTSDPDRFGFLGCDTVKTQHLIAPGLLARDPLVIQDLEQTLAENRNELLDQWISEAEVFADTGENSPDADLILSVAADKYNVQLQKARSGPVVDNVASELDASTVLGEPTRALVHFALLGGRLIGYWCQGGEPEPRFGAIDLGHWTAESLVNALAEWADPRRSGGRALEPVLDGLGADVAGAIAQTLVPLGVRDVLLSPFGPLELVPFHAASTSRGPLIDVFESVGFAPSLRLLAELAGDHGVAGNAPVAFGYRGNVFHLPYAEREIELIASLFPDVRASVGEGATPDALERVAASPRFLHLACHGVLRPERPLISGFELAGSPPSRGFLSSARILKSGDFKGTEFVVLASCSSGASIGDGHAAMAYGGLDGAFLASGARCAVAALWEVNDIATFAFMCAFYSALAEGRGIYDSYLNGLLILRRGRNAASIHPEMTDVLEAALAGIRDDAFAHPYYWGAFKVSGLYWAG